MFSITIKNKHFINTEYIFINKRKQIQKKTYYKTTS